ncbi:MAG TPA: AraC family transcriptional regulator [Burkholderiales bacterium]|nr:AraC family transcriptional regulator [Burkholderiales bacterium]
MLEPLASRPILHSRDFEETRDFLRARHVRFDLQGGERDRAAFEVRYNGVYLPRLWLGYIRYGAPAASHVSPARADYWVHLPMHGRLSVVSGWSRLEYDPRHAALTSPPDEHTLKFGPGLARLCLSIHADALTRHLADLLGDAPREPLRLGPALGLDGGPGLGFARLLHAFASDTHVAGTLSQPLVAADFEQLVMTSLLHSVPHNHSEGLRRRDRRISPRDVRRAVDYLRENAGQPLALGDLVRASGVAGRTLIQHFKDAYGISPMRYLRNHRLLRVREELLRDPAARVSVVATRWGFTHLGRFAQEYRRRFGESPSQSLAGARRRAS